MRDAGIAVVRLGHLAWDTFEPADGEFRFEWFDECMDLMRGAGIGVILDIAVRPAPLWLHRKHPSIDVTEMAIGKTAAANAEELLADVTSSDAPPEVGHITSPSGSFDGFQVEAAELTAMASALDNFEPTAGQIASDAAGVGAAEMTWGLTGLAFETSYTEGCQALIESTQNLTDAFPGTATKLRDCADAYTSTDEGIAGELDKLATDLEG